jgi:tetratricopeptide (TPR) repeat protein
VFDQTEGARHLPFFAELAGLEDGDPAWRSVSAGLVVLRLVDAWIEEGSAAVAADGWGMRSVEAAIEEVPTGLPAHGVLRSVVEALKSSPVSDMHAIAPRLMAYARSLDLDAKWALAADVYETVIAHVHPLEESDVAVNSLLRRGHCLRELGSFAEATSSFNTAGELAHQTGDIVGSLRARIGEAKIVMARGNLPAADAILDETVALATKHDLPAVRSLATHDRAYVAHSRGEYDLAVRLAYDAMRDCAIESERDRILNDLAGSFYMLGVKSAARDAFLILAATAREQYQRWAASINLMELSAEDGLVLQFERYRQQLDGVDLPPILRTQFELHVGRAYQLFGKFEVAKTWLERAITSASAHSFNRFIFAAEAALAGNGSSLQPHIDQALDISVDAERIAFEIKGLRELVEAN